jgi:Holliday junction resolvase RusA-like endonuclease
MQPPADFINANQRLHHHAKAKLTKAWREAAWLNAKYAEDYRQYDRAHVVIGYRFPTNHRRDVQNLQPTSKAICDGLVDAGLLIDDDDLHLIGPDNRRHIPNGSPLVTITIRAIEETP